MDTFPRADVVAAAKQALDAANRSFGHWLTMIIIAVLFAAVLVAWRIWALGRRLARVDELRAAWDTRFAGTTDEVLRLKRKLADDESRAERLEIDIASLRPDGPDAVKDQVAAVQSELAALRERLDRAEEKLDAFADHTVVTQQERAAVEELVRTAGRSQDAVEGLVKSAGQSQAAIEKMVRTAGQSEAAAEKMARTAGQSQTAVEKMARAAGQAQAAAEAAADRAEAIVKRAAARDSLRAADEKLAKREYPAAVRAYSLCLEALEGSGVEDAGLRFHAFHNRALANLRQREFDAVLTDAATIEAFASADAGDVDAARAQGAAKLLAGVARLWQGKVPQALQDLTAAVERDEGARAALQQDEDIAAWMEVNTKKAAPVKRFIRAAAKGPKVPKSKPSSPDSES
ncbi:MAG TPA: hypothetical protein VMH22_11975 [bacterium]|nr:hypothetical protein [bacterium]